MESSSSSVSLSLSPLPPYVYVTHFRRGSSLLLTPSDSLRLFLCRLPRPPLSTCSLSFSLCTSYQGLVGGEIAKQQQRRRERARRGTSSASHGGAPSWRSMAMNSSRDSIPSMRGRCHAAAARPCGWQVPTLCGWQDRGSSGRAQGDQTTFPRKVSRI